MGIEESEAALTKLVEQLDEQTSNETISTDTFDDYAEAVIALAGEYVDLAERAAPAQQWTAAHSHWSRVEQLWGELESRATTALALSGDDDFKAENEDAVSLARYLASFAGAQALFARGQMELAGGAPSAAVGEFRSAANAFQELLDDHALDPEEQVKQPAVLRFMWAVSDYQIPVCQGIDQYRRLDFANSRIEFTRAKVKAQQLAEKLESDEDLEADVRQKMYALARQDFAVFEGKFYDAYVREELAIENFDSAAELCRQAVASKEEAAVAAVEVLPALAPLLQAEKGEWQGYLHYAEGQAHREEQRWDEAIACFRKARQAWEKAGEAALLSALPAAPKMHERIVNSASLMIPAAIRRCERERDLRRRVKRVENEAAEMRAEMGHALQNIGINVNSRSSAEVTSTVQQTTELIVQIEDRSRSLIQELLDKLGPLDVESAPKELIRSEATEVLKSKEKGPPFLERVKRFVGHATEVATGLGRAAEPILTLLNSLSILGSPTA